MAMDPILLQKIFEERGCFNFLKKTGAEVLQQLTEKYPALKDFLTDSAKADFCEGYEKRNQFLYTHSTATELQEILAEHGLLKSTLLTGTDLPAIERAASELAEIPDIKERICQKYPLIAEYEERIRNNFYSMAEQLFCRLIADKERISQKLFDGRPIIQVTGISMGAGDAHRHGQMVTKISTDAGTFYYKPHDCGLDAFCEEIIEKWFSDCLTAAKVVEGKGYAFVSELLRQELTDKNDIGTYFYNFGVMAAMFHGLGSRDMHQENVMACGKKPAVVDVETFLSAQKSLIEPENLTYALNYSVVGIGSFPFRIHKMGFLSAFHLTQQPVLNSLPLFDGKAVDIDGYEQTFLQGFREGYERMIKHRDEVEPLLATHLNSVVRNVRLNTTYYYYIYRNLCMTTALYSVEKQHEALNQLRIPFAQNWEDKYETIINYEKESLLRGDIPYYCVALDGKDLCGETVEQVLLKDNYECSPLQNMRLHLANLSEKEKAFEEDFIFNTLRHVPADAPASKKFPLGTKKATPDDMRQMAESIWQEVQKERIRYPRGFNIWLSTALPLESYLPVGLNVGLSDVARYTAAMIKTGTLSAKETMQNCLTGLQHILQHWESKPDDWKNIFVDVGRYSGCGNVLKICAVLHEVYPTDTEKFLSRYLTLVRENAVASAKKVGVGYGLAGLLLSLTELYQKGIGKGENLDKCLTECASALAEKEFPKSAGGDEGMDGIASAMAKAYACTGEKLFAEVAIKALKAIQDSYRKDLQGWVNGNERIIWLAERAPYSAEIAWHSMDTAEYLPEGDGKTLALDLTRLALESLCQEENLFRRDSLHEGNAMSVMSLTKAAKIFSDKNYLEKAAVILAAMKERAAQEKNFIVTADKVKSFFDASFYYGTLGIGYAALYCMNNLEKGECLD